MSLLSRVRTWMTRRTGAPDAGERPAAVEGAGERHVSVPPPAGAADTAGDALARLGLPGGPSVDDAIALLRRARGTTAEASAVASVLRAASERSIPEPVRVACADLLAARGDEQGALRVIEGTLSTAGLVLAADLYASSGQLARAVGTIERVLARDLDAPGARERHARWSAALGDVRAPVRRLDEVTLVAPQASRSPFRLLREIARGGAGAVYEAEDELLGRKVAFKVYHDGGRAQDALEREVRAAVSLAGPGVVRVYDADPPQGWVALEWIARGSVRDVLRTGDLSALAPVARWARPLARALARVHAGGLVHGDVKPANVLLRWLHDPVLGDFGIARAAGAPAEGGSAGYMSPERLAGRPSDPRDDVYGYGRVLEDVLHRLDEAGVPAAPEDGALRELMLACLGPSEGRPSDGGELVRAIDAGKRT